MGRRWALRPLHAVLAVTALGAIVRFASLDAQSLWYDEGITFHLSQGSFADAVNGAMAHEATPPPYFMLAWLWVRIFGDGEVGLRSLSALAGTLTIPAAYVAARELVDRHTALLVGVLVAVSPALTWYSQEARAYGLFICLSAWSLAFFARARNTSGTGSLAGWAVTSALAMSVHFFAVFLVVPEALLLLWPPAARRRAAAAVAFVAVAGAALIPVALYQREHGGASWIETVDFLGRLTYVPYFFVTGTHARPLGGLVSVAAVALFALCLYAIWRAPHDRRRRGALVALGLGVASIAIPLLGKLAGSDYILERNLLGAWVPLVIFMTAAARIRFGLRITGAAVGVLAVAFVAVNVVVAVSPGEQRDDWRGAARALGGPHPGRITVVAPRWHEQTFDIYRHLTPMRSVRRADEVVMVVNTDPLPFRSPTQTAAPRPPFRLVQKRMVQRMMILRFTAPRPVAVDPRTLSGAGINGASAFIEARA